MKKHKVGGRPSKQSKQAAKRHLPLLAGMRYMPSPNVPQAPAPPTTGSTDGA